MTPDDIDPRVVRLADRLRTLDADVVRAMYRDLGPQLNDHSRDLLDRVVGEHLAAGWRADPLSLALHLEPDGMVDYRHMRFLAQRFRAAVHGESRFQVWNLPAQMQKTTTLRWGIAFALDQDPTLPLIYASYGDTLAKETGIFVRDIARAHGDRLRFDLRPDAQRAGRFLTRQGGGLLCRGLHSGFAGYPAGGVIIDDPIKNWQDAHSQAKRDAAWNEIVSVARLRLREGGWLILAHTRWHQDDPTGRMGALAKELGVDVEFVTLPMLARDNDPLGRAPGEPLEPRRYSLEEAQSRAQFLGSYLANALEQQDPQPEEGGEVLREWWRWTAAPPTAFADSASSWDMKLKDKESGDYVVGLVGGRTGGSFWIVDMLRGQFSQLQTKCAIALTTVRHPQVRAHVVENSGNGPEVMAELRKSDPDFVLDPRTASKLGMTDDEAARVQAVVRRGVPGIVANNAKGSKLVRARAIAGYIEAGDVHLIEGKAWAHALVDEWASFPPKDGGHDDIVDATSQLLARLAKGKAQALPQGDGKVAQPAPAAKATGGVKGRARILS